MTTFDSAFRLSILVFCSLLVTGLTGAQDRMPAGYPNVPHDFPGGYPAALAKAQEGNAVLQFCVGSWYLHGTGITRDYAKALPWLQKAADKSLPAAYGLLGLANENGLGVPKNTVKAVALYKKGANLGDVSCQYYLGNCYLNGIGNPADPAAAANWLEKAGTQGSIPALQRLGTAYLTGIGEPKDVKLGFTNVFAAAMAQDWMAEANLALCYQDGAFVKRDLVLTYKWAKIAVNDSSHAPLPAQILAQTIPKLTPAQIAEGDALAAPWIQGDRRGMPQPLNLHSTFKAEPASTFPYEPGPYGFSITLGVKDRPNLHFKADFSSINSCIDPAVATALRIESNEFTPEIGASNSGRTFTPTGFSRNIPLSFPGVAIADASLELIPPVDPMRATDKLDWNGHIGADIFRHFVVTIDYQRHLMQLRDPANFKPPEADTVLPIAWFLDDPYVEAIVKNAGTRSPIELFRFEPTVDSPVIVERRFANETPGLALVSNGKSVPDLVDGPTLHLGAMRSDLVVGGITVPDVVIGVVDKFPIGGDCPRPIAGAVGEKIWRYFDLTIDFPHNKLYLKRNGDFPGISLLELTRPDFHLEIDTAGIVVSVPRHSPAEKAGLVVGDAIVEVDHIPINTLRLKELRERVESPGVHHLLLGRDGKYITLDYSPEQSVPTVQR